MEQGERETPPFLQGGGACGALIRAHDWAATPLGSSEGWPESLRTLVRLLLASRQPMFLAWGPELTFLYNDGYVEVLGAKHPGIGRPFAELWADIWPQFGPIVDRTLAGEGQNFEDLPIPMRRNGVLEETWFTFSYTPARDETGAVQGVFCACLETTGSVLARREKDAAVAELRESEARLRGFVRASSDILYRADADWTVLQPLEGGQVDARSATPAVDWAERFLIDAERSDVLARVRAAVREGRPYQHEHQLVGADGTLSWVSSRAVPIKGDDGRVREWFGAAADITERKNGEAALAESRARLDNALAIARLGTFEWLLDIDEVLLDARSRELLAFGPEEPVSAADLFARIDPRDVQRVLDEVARARDTGETLETEYRIQTPEGERYVLSLSRPILGADGRPTRMVGAFGDITVRKRTEQALAESEARFRAITDSIDQMIWSTRPDGFHDFYNQRWYDFTGVPLGTTDGEGWNDVLHPEDQPRAWALWRRSLETGEPYEIEYRLRHRSGEYRWVLGRALPMRDDEGEIVRWFGTCTDIHDRKAVEAALREETRTLETLNAVGADLAGELDLETVVQRVTDAGVALTGAQFGAFFYNVVNTAGESYMLDTLSGVDRSHFEAFPMPRNTPVFGPTFAGEGVVRSDDILADPRYGTMDTYGGMPEGHLPVRSYLAVPVTSRSGEVIGGLFFGHEQVGVFEARHERLMVGVAGQAAVALDNARLFQAVQRELEERRATEAALRESEADFRAAAELNPQVAWTAAPDGQLDRVASRWREWTGVSGLGSTWGDSLLPEDLQPGVDAWTRAVTTGVPYDIEHRVVRTNGEVRWLRSRAYPRRDAEGRIVRWYGATEDIHEQKLAELRLQALNETLEARVAERTAERDRLWRLSEDMLARADYDGMMSAVSPAWKRVLGFSEDELLSRPYTDFMHPDDAGVTVEALVRMGDTGTPTRFENRILTTDGSYKPIEWTVAPEPDGENFIAVGRDVSADRQRQAELEAAQEALRQAQKMEAVGQLTGGIAHDFNNLLTGIIGSLDLMKRRIEAGRVGELDRFMDAASTSAQRAAALTHRLLAFARRQSLDVKPVDVNALAASMEELLRRTLGEQVELAFELQPGLWQATTDGNQLETALLNLAINARDAMPDGGKLTVETANARLDEAYVRQHAGVQPGDYVALCVTDTGTGMPADVLARAFDPFFTTKPIGQGTGLGLSMIYGFVSQSGGHARIYSEEGRGTTVKLYLPRSDQEAAAEVDPEAPEAPRGQGETVLVVEDDPAVRLLVLEVLRELGYRTLEAHDGPSALPILDGPEAIDLVVSDVGLPGLNGRQLADEARRRRPGLKVLFITGYAENAAVRSGFLDEGMEMITKPFAVDALAAKVKAMLGRE